MFINRIKCVYLPLSHERPSIKGFFSRGGILPFEVTTKKGKSFGEINLYRAFCHPNDRFLGGFIYLYACKNILTCGGFSYVYYLIH